MKKKYYILFIIVLFLMISVSTYLITSYLVDEDNKTIEPVVGEVKVSLLVYFEHENGTTNASEVEIAPGVNKTGVYNINVVDSGSIEYVENLRIYIVVESTVDTYFRVQVVEQLTLIQESEDGKTEISILLEKPTDFNYETTNWYIDRNQSDYFYYKNKVKADEDGKTEIGLITSYYENQHFISQPLGFTLQIGIFIEAVQALGGPLNNWGQENPLWGGNW
jgi:hypothetical protein